MKSRTVSRVSTSKSRNWAVSTSNTSSMLRNATARRTETSVARKSLSMPASILRTPPWRCSRASG
jgi:hypothetical protein